MSNLGEQAMEILDELHTERLAYESEYIPLADAANLLAAYERTGMDPEAIERMQDAFGRGLTLRTDARERLEIIKGLSTDRLRELVEAEKDGRCVVFPFGGFTDKDGENALKSAMNTCFYHNNSVTRYIADAVAEKLTRGSALKGEKHGDIV